MIYPWQLCLSLAGYVAANRAQGRKRYALSLMLEPTFRCNLACKGCGRIREDKEILGRMLSVDECLAAADESGAPAVCLTGGEPLLHPQIDEIVERLVAKRRFVFLNTNGLALAESLGRFRPSPYLSLVFHLDGLRETHDRSAGRDGLFDTAIAGIRAAKRAGFQVRTNTTVYKGTDWRELQELFRLLSRLEVDGLMVAPAFGYEKVKADIFLSRSEVPKVFAPIYEHRQEFRFYNTPLYLEFLAGKRALSGCRPWSSPTRNPKGWKRPCYLLTDGYYGTFRELIEETPWEAYGVGRDRRCANCMLHSGWEAAALEDMGKSGRDLWRMIRWNLS